MKTNGKVPSEIQAVAKLNDNDLKNGDDRMKKTVMFCSGEGFIYIDLQYEPDELPDCSTPR